MREPSPAFTSPAAVGVLDRPTPAGAAPALIDNVVARVVAVTASPTLGMLICDKLRASESCELVAVVATFDELRAAVAEAEPDVVVIDLNLAPDGVHDICEALGAVHPQGRAVGLVPAGKGAHALALRAYTTGFAALLAVMDDIGNGQLAYAVRCVAAGKPFYGPTVHGALLEHWGPRVLTNPVGLSERELEVARLAAAGASRAEIAEQLYLSPWTVKRHLSSIRTKLGVTNAADRAELAQRLRAFGFLAPTDE